LKRKLDRTITCGSCQDSGRVDVVGACGVEGFGDAG